MDIKQRKKRFQSYSGGARGDSVLKRPQFGSKNTQGVSPTSEIPSTVQCVQHSSGPQGYQACTRCTYIHTGKAFITCKMKINTSLKLG